MARPKNKHQNTEITESNPEPKEITVEAVGKDVGQVVGYSADNQRIRAGEVFTVSEDKFSKRWMKKVGREAESKIIETEAREQTAFSKTNPVTGERKD
jgi:folate-dependent tRNA-U54 methylase TrmFO/GidA